MDFNSENICDALYSWLESPLKLIDPEFQRLDTIPVQKSLLPGIFIEVEKAVSANVGIGNFLGYQSAPGGEITGEIYGRQYNVRINADIWLNYQNRAAALETMQAVTVRLNAMLSDNTAFLREHGILNISLRKPGEIESNAKNDLLPKNMRKTIRRIFQLSLICEFSEIRTSETIKKIITTSELT